MQETLYQTADTEVSVSIRLSDASSAESLAIRQSDAEVSLSDSGCRSLSIRQRMQRLSIRQRMSQTASADEQKSPAIRLRMQKTLYQTTAASDRVSPASVF